MRSSKSRSRSKSNRNRSVGNIVNRVFDSSGPEGKVRGTPQQIIDKYNQLARDAQLSNDRVATENFQQHSEHYTRMLGEALREQEARREQQEQQQRERQKDRGERDQPNDPAAASEAPQRADAEAAPTPAPEADAAIVFEVSETGGDSGLVETPENTEPRPQKRGRGRPRRSEAKDTDAAPDTPAESGEGDARAAE